MANRAMAAKVTRAKREAREAGHREFTKACYLTARGAPVAYDESKVRRIETTKRVSRATMKPDRHLSAAITGSWVIGEYGLISR